MVEKFVPTYQKWIRERVKRPLGITTRQIYRPLSTPSLSKVNKYQTHRYINPGPYK